MIAEEEYSVTKATICLIAFCLMAARSEAVMKLPQADRPLAERCANPPAECRILKIVHHLPEDPAAQDSLINTLIEQGFGGMATNVSFDGYVEDEAKWKSFLQTVGKAKDAGMSLWLYDEKGYPSGTAGGITLRDHPEWEAYTHRRIEGHEVYFLINDSGKPWTGKVTFAQSGPGERWDPATGSMTKLQSGEVDLSLAPYGGTLFRFPE